VRLRTPGGGDRPRGEISRLQMHPVANDHHLIEREPWLGAIPVHEFVDGVALAPLRIWAR
jgi:hypothetical protein